MKTFDQYLIEQKNTHLQHIEELIFTEGVDGTRRAINFLRDLRNMLAGHTKSSISTTVKWDGSPAVFAGVDPRDGAFFVAKKGIFNKDPIIYKSVAEIKDQEPRSDLANKLIIAFQELSKLKIKSGVYQGDLMFTADSKSVETIDDEKFYTFHPNTILYAVPVKSDLGKKIKKAKMGIVWHTSYSGKSFDSMKGSFGKSIAASLGDTSSVWSVDAVYKDVSGTATFTAEETNYVTELLSKAGKIFNQTPASLFNLFKDDEELRIRTLAFFNVKIRSEQDIIGKRMTQQYLDYLYQYYTAEINKKKTAKAKQVWEKRREDVLKIFSRYSKKQLSNLFDLLRLLVLTKRVIIDKMNRASTIGTFLKTKDGLKVTDQEGFVAIDHLSGGAVKLVNRMEFSKANFSKNILKGWQR